MKIAIIAQGAIPAQTANSIQNMKMAEAMAWLGHKVRVFAPGVDPGLGWRQLAHHYGLSRRFNIHWIPFFSALRRYDFAWKAVRASQKWRADLIYTRLPQAAAIAARSLPTIFEVHNLPSGIMGPWLMRHFLDAPQARRLVVITNHLAGKVKKVYQVPARSGFLLVAPSGVDLRRYTHLPTPRAARRKLGLGGEFTAGYTGHLYEGRGIEMILQMARKLPRVFFLLVGGTEEDVARRKGEARGLSNVRFVGFIPNAELPKYQAACDVFLMPHGRKVAGSSGADIAAFTSPLKMFEYLVCGRPILASDLPILREILNARNAVILPPDSIESWVHALKSLQNSPRRRAQLSRTGKQTAALYSWDSRAQHIIQGVAGKAPKI